MSDERWRELLVDVARELDMLGLALADLPGAVRAIRRERAALLALEEVARDHRGCGALDAALRDLDAAREWRP